MKSTVALTAGLMAAAAALAAPANADTTDDAFLDSLTSAGITTALNPSDTVALGQSVCPMLVEPGKSLASVASDLGLTEGMSPEVASMFVGIAITTYCPSMFTQIINGEIPTELDDLGIPGF